MEDDNAVHPLEILSTYAQAGQFIEMRLARLKGIVGGDPEDIEAAEGISNVLFLVMLDAISAIDDAVTIVQEEAPARVLN